MTSLLRPILYMLALLTAQRIDEISVCSDEIEVMDELNNQSQHRGQSLKGGQYHQQQQNNHNQPSSSISSNIVTHHQQCGGILNASHGIIQTPNFPNKFQVPITCVWIIDASQLQTGPNATIIVYLTQLYVLNGLKFTEYMYYGADFKVPSYRVFQLTEDDVTQVAWIQFSSPYLEVSFSMRTLDGTHLRALDRLLDVYGFNITYEVGPAKSYQCNALQCRFLGHCYATHDFTWR